MEKLIEFAGLTVLLTTGASKHECQQWEWYDSADVVVWVQPDGARVLKGEHLMIRQSARSFAEGRFGPVYDNATHRPRCPRQV
jgi:hypothetical protein